MRSEGLGADNCWCQRAVRVMPVKNASQSRWDQTLQWAHTDFFLSSFLRCSSQNVYVISTDLCSRIFCNMSTVWIVDKFCKYFVCEFSVW